MNFMQCRSSSSGATFHQLHWRVWRGDVRDGLAALPLAVAIKQDFDLGFVLGDFGVRHWQNVGSWLLLGLGVSRWRQPCSFWGGSRVSVRGRLLCPHWIPVLILTHYYKLRERISP